MFRPFPARLPVRAFRRCSRVCLGLLGLPHMAKRRRQINLKAQKLAGVLAHPELQEAMAQAANTETGPRAETQSWRSDPVNVEREKQWRSGGRQRKRNA